MIISITKNPQGKRKKGKCIVCFFNAKLHSSFYKVSSQFFIHEDLAATMIKDKYEVEQLFVAFSLARVLVQAT